MSLNIKNEEAHTLAQEIAALTGESLTAAVTEALRERLHRLQRKGMAERLMAIGRDCAARLNAPGKKMMEIDDLYDEKTGLPK
ncbi:MAG: type II toxin-antitoxin system VapB family antitoxin [Rhizomicrobium sp.]